MKDFIYKLLIIISLMLSSTLSNAQQQVQFSQYMYNTQMVNPAYMGTQGKLEAFFIHRSQWVGLEGAPRTQNFGVSGSINDAIAIGLNVVNDKIGPSSLTVINAAISSKVALSNDISLSFGLNGGIDMISVDWSKGQSMVEDDAAMTNNIQNRVRPMVGAGAYLYSDNWYFGVSTPSFIYVDKFAKLGETSIDPKMHLYGIAGYVFDIKEEIKLKPSLLMKGVRGAPITFDLSVNTLIKNQYSAGLGYRFHDAMYVMLGYTFKNFLFIGYAYDFGVNKLRNYNTGSHDIIVKYTLWPKNVGVSSPRFF